MVLKQEEVRKISKGMKKFQGFRDENCEILRSTSSGGRELKDNTNLRKMVVASSTSSGGRELKDLSWTVNRHYRQSTSSGGRELKGHDSFYQARPLVVDLLRRS